jgi:hypothetical protein
MPYLSASEISAGFCGVLILILYEEKDFIFLQISLNFVYRGGNMDKLLVSIMVLTSLIGYVSALDGSGAGMNPAQITGDAILAQYSQYYTMPTGPVTGIHITAPQQYQISGNAPSVVYYQQKAIPYDQYLIYAGYLGGNSLWIQGSTSWTQYAAVPQGGYVSLLAASTAGGNGELKEMYSDGKVLKNSYYYFPGYSQMGFYADTIGQHTLLFVINGQVSNAVVIDVVGYQPPVSQQTEYLQPSYPSPIYRREIYEPGITIHVNPFPGRHRENTSPDDWHHPHTHRGNASPFDG